jgi:LAO/AO transport system kinase
MLVPTTGRDATDRPQPKRPEVLVTTASTGDGVPALLAALDRHRSTARDGRENDARRVRASAQVRSILADRLADRLRAGDLARLSDAVITEVAEHHLDPYTAADRLLEALRRGSA